MNKFKVALGLPYQHRQPKDAAPHKHATVARILLDSINSPPLISAHPLMQCLEAVQYQLQGRHPSPGLLAARCIAQSTRQFREWSVAASPCPRCFRTAGTNLGQLPRLRLQLSMPLIVQPACQVQGTLLYCGGSRSEIYG